MTGSGGWVPQTHWVLTGLYWCSCWDLKNPRTSWLDGATLQLRGSLITTFGTKKEFHYMVRLAWTGRLCSRESEGGGRERKVAFLSSKVMVPWISWGQFNSHFLTLPGRALTVPSSPSFTSPWFYMNQCKLDSYLYLNFFSSIKNDIPPNHIITISPKYVYTESGMQFYNFYFDFILYTIYLYTMFWKVYEQVCYWDLLCNGVHFFKGRIP